MGYIILIFILFPLVGWLIGKLIASILFPKSKEQINLHNSPELPNIHITNHITEQHLHITEEQLKRLSKK